MNKIAGLGISINEVKISVLCADDLVILSQTEDFNLTSTRYIVCVQTIT